MKHNRMGLLVLISVLLMVVGALGISVIVAQQSPTTALTKWEYLTVNYEQYGVGYLFDKDYSTREMLYVDDPVYSNTFDAIIIGSCDISKTLAFDAEAQACTSKNFQGQRFFLNLLGQDGWELISVNNVSTEHSYSLEWIFKRIKQTGS